MPCVHFSIGVHFKMNGEYSSKIEEDCNEFDDVQLVTDALRYAQGKGYRSDCLKIPSAVSDGKQRDLL